MRGWVGHRARLEVYGEEESLLPPAGIRTAVRPVRSYLRNPGCHTYAQVYLTLKCLTPRPYFLTK